MSKNLLIGLGGGLAVVLAILGAVLFMQRGVRTGLAGSILKVRTAPLDENSSVAVLDFRFQNVGDVPFVVRTVTVILEEKDGRQYQGATVSETDAKRLFEGLPLLGQKFNETLVMKDRIAVDASQDRMVAARFEAPESRLENRKRFLVRIEDANGPVRELAEQR
jgi:hypothetical protein